MSRLITIAVLWGIGLIVGLSSFAFAQVPDPATATQAPVPGDGHHNLGIGAETVNPADGSLTFDLPLHPAKGRQLDFTFGVRFSSGNEQYYLSNQASSGPQLAWTTWGFLQSTPLQVTGWSYDVPFLTGQASVYWQAYIPTGCPGGVCQYALNECYGAENYVFRGLDGAQHTLTVGTVRPGPTNTLSNFCPSVQEASPGDNGHGILAIMQSNALAPPVEVIDQAGTVYQFPGTSYFNPPAQPWAFGSIASSITDRNGNEITLNSNNLGYTDTVGRTAISWTGIGHSGDQINVAGLGGPITLQWMTTNLSFPETGQNAGGSGTCTLKSMSATTLNVVSEIDLPNSQKYKFQYDGTYGKVSKITFPTGGYVRYVWGLNTLAGVANASWTVPPVGGNGGGSYTCYFKYDVPAITDRYVSFDGSTEVLHQHFTYTTSWNTSGWTTKTTKITTTDLLTTQTTVSTYTYKSLGPDTNPPYVNASGQVPVETNIVFQDGNNNTFKTINKTWKNAHALLGEQTILDNGQGTATERCYDSNEQVTNLYEYGFQSEGTKPSDPTCYTSALTNGVGSLNNSAIGPLRRQTATTYYPFYSWSFPNWSGTHIVDAPQNITVSDGSGNLAKQTVYNYDQDASSLQGSGAIDLTSPPGASRGNVTTLQRLISGSTYVTSTYTHYNTGQIYTMTDPCGNTTCSDMTGSNHTTTYSYADSYASGTGTPPGQTNAYPTTVTHPNTGVAHIDQFTWGYSDGLIRSHIDQNNLTTTYAYADPLTRLTNVTNPDGGQTQISYNDTPSSPTVTTTKQINLSTSVTSVAISDGLGHATHTELTSDPQTTVYSDTTFDGVGRVWKQSNPYRNNDPTSSPGTTVYAYDTIGRKISETYPDNSVLTTAYCGPSTLVTDPTNHWRRSRTDGLGFLVEVDEPNAIGATVASTGCPGTGEPIWVTTYGNNTLGDLTSVLQNGSRSRSFTYDYLSRLSSSSNPEVGQITYTFDSNSNLQTKVDARSITTTYGYDVLNRQTSRTFSNNDTSVLTTYDGSSCLGLSACQNIGYRTSVSDAAGSESWAYQVDSANYRSVHANQRTTNGITKPSTYYLDLAGNITQVVYPTGRVVNYTYNAANRPITAQDGSNGITYATGPQSPLTGCLSNAVCYTPQGSTYSESIGQSSAFHGLNVLDTFNSRLQPLEIKASSVEAGNAMDLSYNFVDPVTGHNAGHVYSITNNLTSGRSQTFTYDQLNRILSAGTTATTGSYCWGYQYSYDAWGNLLSQAGWTPTYNACTETTMGAVAADAYNHISGLGYDQSGNTTSDGVNNYLWNAEGDIKTAANVNYLYDSDGRRESKSNGKLYWYGSGGEILAETDSSGNTTAEYIFFGGKRVAMLPAGSNSQFYVEDYLGSSRVITQNTGTVCLDDDLAPYGQEKLVVNNCTQNNYRFEGKERDTESGNDAFGARYYNWRIGRWLSGDWSSLPIAVPYANLTNPQTLNLYSMVADDPESFADLDGHQSDCKNPKDNCQSAVAKSNGQTAESKDNQQSQSDAGAKAAQNKKPLTPAQIKKAFYKEHGKDFNAAIQKVFGKDASKVPTQTLANSPKLDTSKSRTELSQMKGNKEPVEGFNRPDMSQYPAGPIPAQNGTVYISSDIVNSGDMPEIFGTWAHETANLLDMQINARETTYGNPNDPVDKDTGQQVEKTEFPQ